MQCHHHWVQWHRSACSNATAIHTCSPIPCTRWVVPTARTHRARPATPPRPTSSRTTAHQTADRPQASSRCRLLSRESLFLTCKRNSNEGVITAGVSVPIQIPSQGSDIGTNYWPRLQWSSFFGLPTLGESRHSQPPKDRARHFNLFVSFSSNRCRKSIFLLQHAIMLRAWRSKQKDWERRLISCAIIS